MWTEKTIDRDGQQKLYVQIYNIFKEKIEKGEWDAGCQIPTEDELCKTYDVSKATIRIAVVELVREGYLKKVQGKGTFVTCCHPNSDVTLKTRLTENMFGEGVKLKKEVLVRGVKQAAPDIRSYLKTDDDVIYFLLKRVVDGEPAYIEESYIPVSMVSNIDGDDVCRTSLYDLIQERGIQKIYKVIQTIEVADTSGDAAEILKIENNSAALLLHRLLLSSESVPIAYTRIIGSGRKYKFQTEFERIK